MLYFQTGHIDRSDIMIKKSIPLLHISLQYILFVSNYINLHA